MKNCLMVSVFLLAASLCFAQITGNVEIYGGAALFDETSGMNGPETVYKSASVSAGISGGVYFNNSIGLKAYLDFLIPLAFTADPDGGTAVTRKDYDFLLGMDEFFGVVYNVVKKDRLKVPVMAGFHGKLFFSTISDYFTAAINSGIGLGIGVEYTFSNNWYILGRVNGSFDFLGFSIMTPPEGGPKFDMALIRTWGFAPHIGIGFRF
ncbi:hypothetical protein AGMMS49944_19170 [Spirochaetia bacterium]|nr:hypothetical protein AGMMS49944_19170 [Spirochaetia bacterium]